MALTVAIGASTVIIKTVSATDSSSQCTSIIQKLATKFGLPEADVEAAFTEHRAQLHKEHEQSFTDKLNQTVTDDKLATAQKDAVLAKHVEVKNMRNAK